MNEELFNFLLNEEDYTLEQIQQLYKWDKDGAELANKITDRVNNKPNPVCEIAMDSMCSRCPIYRVKDRLPDSIELSCVAVYIIINLLKEEK